MNAAQATETIDGDAYALEIREFDAAIVADHDVLHTAGAIY
jgi:hypothetical protein